VDEQHARELLERERARIERTLAQLEGEPLESDQNVEPGDVDSEDLYQDEFNATRAEDVRAELAALERAEERLANGKYGLSVVSGEPIPDGRLETVPTAERTVEEQERYERGGP
jgi:DnaK suppressor protein